MLNEIELTNIFNRLQVIPNTRDLICNIRKSVPVRPVDSRVGNVCFKYPSPKTGYGVSGESHTVELPAVYEYEHDPNVQDYLAQPTKLKLKYFSAKRNRPVGFYHTPDFLVIRNQEICFEEWKTEEELEKQFRTEPNRYQKDKDGKWRCPPGEEAAANLGLTYRVRSNKEINPVLYKNLRFLSESWSNKKAIPEAISSKIEIVLAESGQASLSKLLMAFDVVDVEYIYDAIAQEEIFVDLSTQLLSDPDHVIVFADPLKLQAHKNIISAPSVLEQRTQNGFTIREGARLTWDGKPWSVINVGQATVSLIDDDKNLLPVDNTVFQELIRSGKVQGVDEGKNSHLPDPARLILGFASKRDLAIANKRFDTLRPYLENGGQPPSALPRTIRRWASQYDKSEQLYGCGYIGLIPKHSKKGNRRPKVEELEKQLLLDFIENDYETKKQKSRRSSYALYKDHCDSQGLTALSYKSFTNEVRNRDEYRKTLKRQGPRAAYKAESSYDPVNPNALNKAQRAFEEAHIDHTQVDLELSSSITDEAIGRPWLTLMIDTHTRVILAFYLTFDSPSYRSCMGVLRECVRRHGRLPDKIVVDNGAEFNSIYFEALLAQFRVIKISRPPAKGRFGSIGERIFSTLNTQFLYNLMGNTQITKNVRQVTKSVNPKNLALWTFDRFQVRLAEWCYEVYPNLKHETLKMTPKEMFERSLAQSGLRSSRLIAYTQDFIIATLPSTPRGKSKVQANRGVLINYIFYWHDAFRATQLIGTRIPVRYDPFDISVAYAFAGGRWVKCRSQYAAQFAGYTEKDIRHASTEIRRLAQQRGRRESINASTLAKFLVDIESEESYRLQHLRSQEMRLARSPVTASSNQSIPTQVLVNTPVELDMEDDISDAIDVDATELELLEDF